MNKLGAFSDQSGGAIARSYVEDRVTWFAVYHKRTMTNFIIIISLWEIRALLYGIQIRPPKIWPYKVYDSKLLNAAYRTQIRF